MNESLKTLQNYTFTDTEGQEQSKFLTTNYHSLEELF